MRRHALGALLLLTLLTACLGRSPAAPEPAGAGPLSLSGPPSRGDLAAVNCRAEDLPVEHPYVVQNNPVPEDAAGFLGGPVVARHDIRLGEITLTYHSIHCTLAAYANETEAQAALAVVCNQPDATAVPDLGDAACRRGEGVVHLVAREETLLLHITADLNGSYAHHLAETIAGRWR